MNSSTAAVLGLPALAAQVGSLSNHNSALLREDPLTPESLEQFVLDLVAELECFKESRRLTKSSGSQEPRLDLFVEDENAFLSSDDEDEDDSNSPQAQAIAKLRARLPVESIRQRPSIFMYLCHLTNLVRCLYLDDAVREFFADDLHANSRFVIGGARAAGLCSIICSLSSNELDDDDLVEEDLEKDLDSCGIAKQLLEMVPSRVALWNLARANKWLVSRIRRDCEACNCKDNCQVLIDTLDGVGL